MRPTLYSTLLLILLYTSCQNPPASWQPTIPSETFTVPCGVDTSLQTEHGLRIEISANSFACDEGEAAQFRFTTALTKQEMILYRLSTVADDGRLLESGGMFRLELLEGSEISAEAPLKVHLPGTYFQEDMQQFVQNAAGNWQLSDQELELPMAAAVNQGEALFRSQCAACHNANLRDDMTGPALGNVHLFREAQWLRDFTRNSQSMIAAGDPLALLSWKDWSPVIMSSYEHLSDAEIDAIYGWIANESGRLGIDHNEVVYPMRQVCDTLFRADQNGLPSEQIARVDCITINSDGSRDYNQGHQEHDGGQIAPPSIIDSSSLLYPYQANVSFGDWYNVDRYMNVDTYIEPIIVKLNGESDAHTFVAIAFRSFEGVVELYSYELGVYEFHRGYYSGDRLNFPMNEWVDVIAYRIDPHTGETLSFGHLEHLLSETKNTLEIDLAPTQGESLAELLSAAGL